MQNKKTFIAIILMTLFSGFLGCVQVKDKSKASEKKQQPLPVSEPSEEQSPLPAPIPPAENTKDNESKDNQNGVDSKDKFGVKKKKLISIRLNPQSQPYSYTADIYIENAEEKTILKKKEMKSEQSWVLNYEPNTYLKDKIESGKTYRYEILDSTEMNTVVDYLQVTVPQDLVLSGEIQLTEKIKTQLQSSARVFLDKTVVLTTQGQDLLLRLEEIVSDGARIRTFAPDATAVLDQKGRSGGRISIYSQKASGYLHFELRGENGGAGSPGKSQARGEAGKNGTGHSDFSHAPNTNKCIIRVQPTPGGNGLPGENGKNGQPGGNTGSLILSLESEEKFDFRAERFQGLGGLGGAGGKGGAGGLGGAFVRKSEILCQDTKAADGKAGADGLPGQNSFNGSTELICVKRSWEKSPSCY